MTVVANIVTKREELEAALAEAEAALAAAAVDTARIGIDRVGADANLEKARACCRQIRAALVKLSRAEYLSGSDERNDAKAKQPVLDPGKAAVAVPAAVQTTSPKAARTQPPLVRQTVSLLGLTLAYLQYFYFDVQLQIVSLPSVFG
jgi:multidrug resistance efflux pump